MKNIHKTNIHEPSTREVALAWWNGLKDNNDGDMSKWALGYEHFGRHWMSLTGREIEIIYDKIKIS